MPDNIAQRMTDALVTCEENNQHVPAGVAYLFGVITAIITELDATKADRPIAKVKEQPEPYICQISWCREQDSCHGCHYSRAKHSEREAETDLPISPERKQR